MGIFARTKGLTGDVGVSLGDAGGESKEMIVGSLTSLFVVDFLTLRTVTVGLLDEIAGLPLLFSFDDLTGDCSVGATG